MGVAGLWALLLDKRRQAEALWVSAANICVPFEDLPAAFDGGHDTVPGNAALSGPRPTATLSLDAHHAALIQWQLEEARGTPLGVVAYHRAADESIESRRDGRELFASLLGKQEWLWRYSSFPVRVAVPLVELKRQARYQRMEIHR